MRRATTDATTSVVTRVGKTRRVHLQAIEDGGACVPPCRSLARRRLKQGGAARAPWFHVAASAIPVDPVNPTCGPRVLAFAIVVIEAGAGRTGFRAWRLDGVAATTTRERQRGPVGTCGSRDQQASQQHCPEAELARDRRRGTRRREKAIHRCSPQRAPRAVQRTDDTFEGRRFDRGHRGHHATQRRLRRRSTARRKAPTASIAPGRLTRRAARAGSAATLQPPSSPHGGGLVQYIMYFPVSSFSARPHPG